MEIVTANSDSVPTTCEPAWRASMRSAIRDPGELCRRLQLPEGLAKAAAEAAADFPLFVPLSFVNKMRPGDRFDPLLLQVLPLEQERQSADGFTADPLQEQDAALRPGLLQKYQGRALLVATGVCAVHCRYCFRRHFPYHDGAGRDAKWNAAIEALADDPAIDEVLLSGGDPLTIDDEALAALAAQLEAIPHLSRLRIHTRLPIVMPERVDGHLLAWIARSRLAVVVVVHANHEREIDPTVVDAIGRLRSAGATLLNQSVLLRGVNDSVEAQESLCRHLVNIGVTPYYLHQMDRVAGAAHFEADAELGRRIVAELRRRLPGYAVPRFVREVAGDAHKRVLA